MLYAKNLASTPSDASSLWSETGAGGSQAGTSVEEREPSGWRQMGILSLKKGLWHCLFIQD